MTSILVVEDDEHLRRLYRVLLGGQGYRVEEAADGEEGFRKALATLPACIISDSMMPKMDGLEMLLQLRSHHAGSPPAIFVTAVAQMPSPEEQRAAGIVEVVAKPFEFDRMIAAVRKWAGEPSK